MHRIHNGSKKHYDFLNNGLDQTLVHATKWVMVSYYNSPLGTAISLMFLREGSEEATARDAATEYYKLVNEAIDMQHKAGKGASMLEILSEMGYDPNDGPSGVVGVRTCCELRWGSVGHAAGDYLPMTWPLALAIVRRFAFGTDEAKKEAAVAIASHRGFIPSEHPRIKLEPHAQRVFAFCTRTQDVLQLAIMSFVYKLTTRLFLIHGSSDHECGTHAMMGLNGVVRNVLLVLSRDIWVAVRGARRGRPNGPWTAHGRGRGRKLANPFRTDGAEFDMGPSILLLDPACGPKVAKTLDFACDELAERAVPELVAMMRRLAMREGEVLPEDPLAAYNAAYPELAADLAASGSTEAIKMSQMQFLLRIVLRDVQAAIRSQMQRELFGLKGILAGMTGTERSSKFVYVESPNILGAPNEQFIISPTAFALAHAAAFAIGAGDLVKAMEPQLEDGRLTDFLPTYGEALSDECRQQAEEFAGIRNRNDRVEDGQGLDVRTLPQIQGCANGENMVDGQRFFYRPLQLWETLFRACSIAQYAAGSSKRVESSMSTPCALARTKPRLSYPLLVHLMRRLYWLDPNNERFLEWVKTNNNDAFWAAGCVARLAGWIEKIYAKDQLRCDTMHDNHTQHDPKKMPAVIRNGGKWRKTNTVEESRTAKFAQPANGSDEQRKLDTMILNLRARAGRAGAEGTDKVQLGPSAVAVDKQLKTRARAVRAKLRKATSCGRPADGGSAADQASPPANCGPAISAVRCQRRRFPVPAAGKSARVGHGGSSGGGAASRGNQDCLAGGAANSEKRASPDCAKRRRAPRNGRNGGAGDSDDEEWQVPSGVEPQPAGEAPRVTRVTRASVEAPSAGAAPAIVSSGAGSASADVVGAVESSVDGIQGGPATAVSPLSSEPLQAAAPGAGSADVGADSDNEPLFRNLAVPEEFPSKETNPVRIQSQDSESDKDDVPLADWRKRDGESPSCHSESESDDDDTLPDSITENKAWSVDFCHDIHNVLYDQDDYEGPWELSRVVKNEKDSISVTRKPRQIAIDLCQGRHVDLKICFDVTTRDDVFGDEDQGGHYFIMFDAYAGAMMIEIESIAKDLPKKKDAALWAKSATFRRVYRASEAMNRTDSEMDQKQRCGKRSLQKFAELEVEGDPATVTYHVGDCIYTGDVRTIIGVVRWFSASYKDSNHPSLNPAKWPYPQADLAYAGPPFSERASRPKAAAQ
jgi:hypothetical protein